MRLHDLVFLCVLALILVLTRIPFAPKYLFHFDSVNMALAIEDFDPHQHQPQPPGYPLYVVLLKMLHGAGLSVEHTMIASAVVAGALAGWLLWRFCSDMGSCRAGWMSAAVLLFSPVFWFASVTNQSRGFGAVASAGAAWLAWRAGQHGAHPGWLIGAAAFLGTLAGFRPVESLMLSPLLLWALWRGRPSWKTVALAVAAGAIPIVAWGSWLLAESRGLESYMDLLSRYSAEQGVFAGSSGLAAFLGSLRFVVLVHLAYLAPWIWVLLFARPKMAGRWEFLVVWVAPSLVFQVLGHAADPSHLLPTVTAMCWVGGWALDALDGRKALVAAGLAACLGTLFFLRPLRSPAQAASLFVLNRVNKANIETVDIGRAARAKRPFTIVLHDSPVTWRHLVYYLPGNPLWVYENNRWWSPTHEQTPKENAAGPFLLVDDTGTRVVEQLPAALP